LDLRGRIRYYSRISLQVLLGYLILVGHLTSSVVQPRGKMHMRHASLTFLMCLGACMEVAHAQSNIFDNCKTIITDGSKEYSIQTDSRAYLNSVFDKYCDSSGSAKSSSLGIGLDAFVNTALLEVLQTWYPASAGGGYRWTFMQVRQNCRS
jgi:hypothetical protein